jgi:hypothetical protein
VSSKIEGPPEAKAGDAMVNAVIYPESKKVACVLLQAVYGGSSYVPQLFDTKFWAVAPMPGARACSATIEQWRWLADHWASPNKEKR